MVGWGCGAHLKTCWWVGLGIGTKLRGKRGGLLAGGWVGRMCCTGSFLWSDKVTNTYFWNKGRNGGGVWASGTTLKVRVKGGWGRHSL